MRRLIAPLLFVACIHNDRGPSTNHCRQEFYIHGDISLSNTQRQDVEDAAVAWHDAVGVFVHIQWDLSLTSQQYSHMVVNVPDGASNIPITGNKILGWMENGSIFLISDRIPRFRYKQIAMHEFGHMLGVPHNYYGLMKATDDADIDELQPVDVHSYYQHCE